MGEKYSDPMQYARGRVLFQTMGWCAKGEHRSRTRWPNVRRVSRDSSESCAIVFNSRRIAGRIRSRVANKVRTCRMDLDQIGPWSEIKLAILRDYAGPYSAILKSNHF